MRLAIPVVCLIWLLPSCGGQPKGSSVEVTSETYRAAQDKIFAKKTAELVAAGRVPAGVELYQYLGVYGEHSTGRNGWFGAYTFSPEAFEQAKKMWIVDGYMRDVFL